MKIVLLLWVLILGLTGPLTAATCAGEEGICHACKNCRYCKHCAKEGGSCSVKHSLEQPPQR